jgi:hypothetical protein
VFGRCQRCSGRCPQVTRSLSSLPCCTALFQIGRCPRPESNISGKGGSRGGLAAWIVFRAAGTIVGPGRIWFRNVRWSEHRLKIARELLGLLEHRRWYRFGRRAPDGSNPIDFQDPDCKWWYRDDPKRARGPIYNAAEFAPELRFVAEQMAKQARCTSASAAAEEISAGEPRARLPPTTRSQVPPEFRCALTALLRTPSVRKAWRARLPGTTAVMKEINRTPRTRSIIGMSDWTRGSRWGILATAFDYAVGCFLAQTNIESVFERLDEVADADSYAQIAPICEVLPALLEAHLREADQPGSGLRQLDALRVLLLIAEIDAVFRSGGRATLPNWLGVLSRRHVSSTSVTQQLRRNYPDEAVLELEQLLSVAKRELPLSNPLVYNPVFGGAPGLEHIGADGDLIAGNTLIELKVSSKEGFEADALWQLLGYAALDELQCETANRQRGSVQSSQWRLVG